MAKVNILHITPGLALGGAERMMLAMIKGLNKEKYNIKLCCWRGSRELKNAIEKAGAEVIDLKQEDGNIIRVVSKMRRAIKEHNIELIHTYLFDADLCGFLAGKTTGVSIIVSSVPSFTFLWKKKHQLRYKFLSLFFDRFITISEAIAKFMVNNCKISPKKVTAVHAGFLDEFNRQTDAATVSDMRKKFALTENNLVIGTVARLDSRKGYFYLLDAASKIIKDYPEVKLICAGGGEMQAELEEYARKLGIESEVIFAGTVNDVPNFLGLLDIFTLPSLDEGLGIVILEAMNAGLAVVASNVGGIPEMVDEAETGLLVEPANAEALANALITLIKDKDLRIKMGELAKQRVKRFSSQEMTRKLEEIYDFCIERKLKGGQ
ncbi:MAG: glycosyltransferase [Omnitrophica bacterium]|nr:glycosyltransferase [Candidatus Omnitrophota bacterium]